MFVEEDITANKIIESFDEADNSAFTGSGYAHESRGLAGRNRQVDIFHYNDFRTRGIDVSNMAELERTFDCIGLLTLIRLGI